MLQVVNFMGVLLFAGNLLIAIPEGQSVFVLRSVEQSEQSLRKALVTRLEARGIESEAAAQIIGDVVGPNLEMTSRALMNMAIVFPEVHRSDLLDHIANAALRRERFSFDDYDAMVALLQRLKGGALEASDYTRLSQAVGQA